MALRADLIRLARENPELRRHLVPLLRQARHTRDHDRLKTVFDILDKPLMQAVRLFAGWQRKDIPDGIAAEAAYAAKGVLEVLHVEFENKRHQTRAKKFLTRIRNLRKMILAWSKVKSGAELQAVFEKQNTKARDPWQKYIVYRDEVLGLIDFFSTDIETQIAIDKFSVVLMTAPRTDWDEGLVANLRWVLNETTRLLKGAGFGKFAQGVIQAYPGEKLAGKGHSTLAYYRLQGGIMALTAGGERSETLKTLIHEFGHKVYFEGMPSNGRAAWAAFFEGSKGLADVDKIISAWETYLKSDEHFVKKYGRYWTYFRDHLKKTDPDLLMWGDMVMDALQVREDFQFHGAPKKGTKPGLDVLIERKGEAKVFLHPVTSYSATSAEELFAEVFSYYIVAGPQRIPEVVRSMFYRAVPQVKRGSGLVV